MPTAAELLTSLEGCPKGTAGWRQFEDVGIEILKFLFTPPLTEPIIQPRSYSGIDRRDALLPNRIMDVSSIWGQLRQELSARMVLVEFKNYEGSVAKEEVDQTRNYLTTTIGKFGMIISRNVPSPQALLRRNQVYTQEQKVLVFLTDEDLKELIRIKDRGDDPAVFIMELVELFYAQYE